MVGFSLSSFNPPQEPPRRVRRTWRPALLHRARLIKPLRGVREESSQSETSPLYVRLHSARLNLDLPGNRGWHLALSPCLGHNRECLARFHSLHGSFAHALDNEIHCSAKSTTLTSYSPKPFLLLGNSPLGSYIPGFAYVAAACLAALLTRSRRSAGSGTLACVPQLKIHGSISSWRFSFIFSREPPCGRSVNP